MASRETVYKLLVSNPRKSSIKPLLPPGLAILSSRQRPMHSTRPTPSRPPPSGPSGRLNACGRSR